MKFPGNFRNFPQNLPEIFTTFCNFYEFHSQNFYILHKNFINNYYIYKIYPTISTDQNCWSVYIYERRKIWVSGADKNCIINFWCIAKKPTSALLPDSEFTNQNCHSVYTKEHRKIWVSGADKNCIINFWCISRK